MTDQRFPVGARIKAYDFQPCPGRPDQYVEGVIVRIDEHRGLYEVVVMKDACFSNPPRPRVMVPMPGRLIMLEFEGRVTRLDDDTDPEKPLF